VARGDRSKDEWAVPAPLLPAQAITLAELGDDIDWHAQVDATVVRTHQHAAGAAERG
jgi:hypothetical protein